jgi:hypothetical protein
MRYVLREIPADGDKPAIIVTASHTENDMSYASGAEARL